MLNSHEDDVALMFPVDVEAFVREGAGRELATNEQAACLLFANIALPCGLGEDAVQLESRTVVVTGVFIFTLKDRAEEVEYWLASQLSLGHILDHIPHDILLIEDDLQVDVGTLVLKRNAVVAIGVTFAFPSGSSANSSRVSVYSSNKYPNWHLNTADAPPSLDTTPAR